MIEREKRVLVLATNEAEIAEIQLKLAELNDLVTVYVGLDDDFFSEHGHMPLLLALAGYQKEDEAQPLYYNNLALPDYWEVRTEPGERGRVQFWGQKKAVIDFCRPVNKRYVSKVSWLDKFEKIQCIDEYNKYGKKIASVFYDNDVLKTKIYYDCKGREFAQTVPNSQALIVYNRGSLDGYYPNRLALFKAFLREKHLSSFAIAAANPKLLKAMDAETIWLNFEENQDFEKVMSDFAQTPLILDFTDQSQSLSSHYIKVLNKQNEVTLVPSKSIFILTASDHLYQIDELIEALPDFTFYIGARTTVSDKLMQLDIHPNVTILPILTLDEVNLYLKRASFYLDINRSIEVDNILSRAALENLCILSFKDYCHQPQIQEPSTLFEVQQITEFAKLMRDLATDSSHFNALCHFQREQLPFQFIELNGIGEEDDNI